VSKAVANDFVKRGFALARELQQDSAAILAGGRAFEQAVFFQAIREFNDGVVFKTELRGELLNGGLGFVRETCDGQEKLVLLRLQSFGAGCVFAAAQESREVIAEFGELHVLSVGECYSRAFAQMRIGHSYLLQPQAVTWLPDYSREQSLKRRAQDCEEPCEKLSAKFVFQRRKKFAEAGSWLPQGESSSALILKRTNELLLGHDVFGLVGSFFRFVDGLFRAFFHRVAGFMSSIGGSVSGLDGCVLGGVGSFLGRVGDLIRPVDGGVFRLVSNFLAYIDGLGRGFLGGISRILRSFLSGVAGVLGGFVDVFFYALGETKSREHKHGK
jgi:hypothetical protein